MTTAEQFREGLPVAADWIYLNNAATSPTHEKVRAAMMSFEEDRARRAERAWDDWVDAVGGFRNATAWFFESKPEEVALLKNTSDAISTVAAGIHWKRGDEVVTTDAEFPSNILPWRRLASRGVELKIVPSHKGLVREDDVERALSQKTRLLTFSSVMYATGQAVDVKRLTKAAHDRGAEVLVDVIQGAGAVPTSFKGWDVDYLACGGHKWLMAPLGVGTLIVRHELVGKLESAAVGWYGLEDNEDFSLENQALSGTARRFEIGNLNLGGFSGWRQALGILTTVPDRHEKVVDLSGRLIDKLRSEGLTPITPASEKQRAGIVSVEVKQIEDAVAALRKKRVLVSARGPYIRFSPHFWNTRDEVLEAAGHLAEFVRTGGQPQGRGGPPQRRGGPAQRRGGPPQRQRGPPPSGGRKPKGGGGAPPQRQERQGDGKKRRGRRRRRGRKGAQ